MISLKRITATAIALLTVAVAFPSSRHETLLEKGWEFKSCSRSADGEWKPVTVPHDWAIYGPFSRDNDLQCVAVEQNGETEKTWKTGRTGGLPFINAGCYKRELTVGDTVGKCFQLLFDGAMSNAHVFLNGSEVAFWPYGYNSFVVDLTGKVRPGGNELEVDLENYEKQSRWYPGAGLYRNVHFIETGKTHIPVWGTYITTPNVTDGEATVQMRLAIDGTEKGERIDVTSVILSPEGKEVARASHKMTCHGQELTQNFIVKNPQLWSISSPSLYRVETVLSKDGLELDKYCSSFGIRKIDFIPEKGFFLNGEYTKFKGVNNHHDLGPLGAAVNREAIRHQIELLKDMGCNAIRTSHNMPAPELVELCDEMGMMLMVEPFDDWSFRPKSENGYGAIFKEWAERDMHNMVVQYRNHPSVVIWSIGNEVPSQWGPDGVSELVFLQDIVHQLDPTRPVTCGMDQIGAVLDNGFAATLDIPSFNYKPQYYEKAYEVLPQKLILGTETASTVSSRGKYYFPVHFEEHYTVLHSDNHSSSYDNEACYWSNAPDIDFLCDDTMPWMIGQFVWTGFDYLGEPSPYDTDAWPSHSSYFGILDLASLPKDRYYLYRSVWNTDSPTLHILPHWNWKGHEGEEIPVMVYTSYPKAELFINGKSQGIREKNSKTLENRYRMIWENTVYEPGDVKVVAYDESGNAVEEKVVKTAGKAHHLVLTSNKDSLTGDGKDLAYITVQVADKDGNILPDDLRKVKFEVSGVGSFRAAANGDPTSLDPFHLPEMPLFSGAATAILQSGEHPGTMTMKASAKGVKSASLTLQVE